MYDDGDEANYELDEVSRGCGKTATVSQTSVRSLCEPTCCSAQFLKKQINQNDVCLKMDARLAPELFRRTENITSSSASAVFCNMRGFGVGPHSSAKKRGYFSSLFVSLLLFWYVPNANFYTFQGC